MRIISTVLLPLLMLGCMNRPVYTEVSAPDMIGNPPGNIQLIDPTGYLHTSFKQEDNSTVTIEVYKHCAACTSASARALGSDFDGYVRITVYDPDKTIARAQMDYKGELSPRSVQNVYAILMQKLQWRNSE